MATPTTSAPTTRAGAGVPSEAARRAMTRCAPNSPQTRDLCAPGPNRPEVPITASGLGPQDAQGAV